MCTAVVGGSAHRAATRVSAAANHSSPAVSTSHRTTDRSGRFRRGVLNVVTCLRITLQDTVRKFGPRLSAPNWVDAQFAFALKARGLTRAGAQFALALKGRGFTGCGKTHHFQNLSILEAI